METGGFVALIAWVSWASWGIMIADGILETAGPTLSYNEAIGIVASGGLPWIFLIAGLLVAKERRG